MTMNGHWGYNAWDDRWKSTKDLLQKLIDIVSKGGNFLLNVGPNARGEIEPKAIERLRSIGEWMRLHGRSIYGCGASDFQAPPDCRYTQNGRRLYLHIFSWPFRHIHLGGLANRIEYAQFLNDASEVKLIEHDPSRVAYLTGMGTTPGAVILELPVQKPDVVVPVVELFLKEG
jgi:alpha-L-fucosidase